MGEHKESLGFASGYQHLHQKYKIMFEQLQFCNCATGKNIEKILWDF